MYNNILFPSVPGIGREKVVTEDKMKKKKTQKQKKKTVLQTAWDILQYIRVETEECNLTFLIHCPVIYIPPAHSYECPQPPKENHHCY